MKNVIKANVFAVAALAGFTALSAFAASAKSVKLDGWISETKCGAAHASLAGANPECVAKCIKEGAKPIFVDDAKQQLWTIDNPDAIKAHYGHHIAMTGTADASTMTVHVDKVSMLPDQGKKSDMMMH